jgi:hypothetical protein
MGFCNIVMKIISQQHAVVFAEPIGPAIDLLKALLAWNLASSGPAGT